MPIDVLPILNGYDDVSSKGIETGVHVRNIGWAILILPIGTEGKTPVNRSIGLVFRGSTIPKGATINSASIEFVFELPSSASSPNEIIIAMSKNGLWDPAAGRVGWTTTPYVDHGIITKNSGGTDIGGTWTGSGGPLFNPFRHSEFDGGLQSTLLSQSVIATATDSIDNAVAAVFRVGSPVGNVWIETWTDNGDDTPNTKIGQSDNVDASTVTTDSAGGAHLVFSWSTPVAVVNGVKYVHVINGDWDPDDGHLVWARASNVAGSIRAGTFGTGFGFQLQNALMTEDMIDVNDSASVDFIAGAVPWTVPTGAEGTTATTPDIAGAMQLFVDDVSYVDGDPLGFWITEDPLGAGTGLPTFAAFENVDHAAAILTVDWTARRRNRLST